MPGIRIASGVGLGLASIAFFIMAAGARDGAPWVAPVAGGVLLTGAGMALAAGVIALGRGNAPSLAPAAVRVGAGALLGVIALGVVAAPVLLGEAAAFWVALEVAVLIAATILVIAGMVELHRTRARTSVVRAWATLGATTLLVLAVVLAFD